MRRVHVQELLCDNALQRKAPVAYMHHYSSLLTLRLSNGYKELYDMFFAKAEERVADGFG